VCGERSVNTSREASGERKRRKEMGSGGRREFECIGSGRSPHPECH